MKWHECKRKPVYSNITPNDLSVYKMIAEIASVKSKQKLSFAILLAVTEQNQGVSCHHRFLLILH